MFKAIAAAFGNVEAQIETRKLLDIDDPRFTPDWWRLSAYEKQNFFIYNQFMRGCQGHAEFLEGHADRKCAAFTFGSRFVLWQKDLGLKTQVFALKISDDQLTGPDFNLSSWLGKPRRLLGQVFSVDTEIIPKLDTELQNGVMYDRERIRVNIPWARKTKLSSSGISDIEIVELTAWAYIARQDYWSELMNPADKRCRPVKMYQSTADGEPYYFYSEKKEQAYRK